MDIADAVVDLADICLCGTAELVNRNRLVVYFREGGVVEGFQSVHAESIYAFFD